MELTKEVYRVDKRREKKENKITEYAKTRTNFS